MKTLWITIAGIISMIGVVFFAFIKGQKSGSDSEKVKSQDEEIKRKDRELENAEKINKSDILVDAMSDDAVLDGLRKKNNNK